MRSQANRRERDYFQWILIMGILFFAGSPVCSQSVDTFNPGADGTVSAIALDRKGGILLGGRFRNLGGMPRSRIGRLHTDGSVDVNFNPGANGPTDFSVECLGMQVDDKILAGGTFSNLGGQPRLRLGRLGEDGMAEAGFNPEIFGGFSYLGVNGLIVQPNGKILVGGSFIYVGAEACYCLGRLNSDGSLSESLNFQSTPTTIQINAMALQPDGKILVGGNFNFLGGYAATNLGRLNAEGTVDTNFNVSVNGEVYSLVQQADGKILVGGGFSSLGGHAVTNLGRLNFDGTPDVAFVAPADSSVFSVALQTDGRILVGGSFSMLAGQPRDRLGRLNSDGSLDMTFNPGASGAVYALALDQDGKILVGGNFRFLGGQSRTNIARLNNNDAAFESLSVKEDGSIRWMRGGSSPEVWRTSFECATNGTDWVMLGDGTRIQGGWKLDGISLPSGSILRARGFTSGGFQNGSTWFVESKLQLVPPSILVNDGAVGFNSNRFGFNIGGQTGQSFVLESSTNLIDWTALLTNTLGAGSIYFSDADATNYEQRFYRVRPR